MSKSSMGRRAIIGGDEHNAFTGWRKFYCYLARPGVTASIKRTANRRDRMQAKRDIRSGRV